MLKKASKGLTHIFIIVFTLSTLNFAAGKITNLPKGVSIHRLDNGLEVLLIEKPSLPMCGINTVVKVGSAYENFATSGMSHMLEHLLFNGTSSMTQKELYDSTDIIGGYNNANTGEYYTNFMMVTPAENIIAGMKLQAAMLFDSVIPEGKFEKEKGIVLEEIAKSLTKSSEQIERNVLSIIYEGHALSLPTLGTYSTIQNMNRDDVYNFYKNYYTPNNMLVSVIGNFSTTEMLKNINDIYGKNKPNLVTQQTDKSFLTGFSKPVSLNIGKTFHRFYSGKNIHAQLFYELNEFSNLESFELLQLYLDEKENSIFDKLKVSYDELEGVKFSVREYPVVNYLQAAIILKNDVNIDKIIKSFRELLETEKFIIPTERINTEVVKSKTEFLKNTEKPHMFGIYNADVLAEYGIEEIFSSYSGEGLYRAAEEIQSFRFGPNFITIIQHPNIEENKEETGLNSKATLYEGESGKATIIIKQNNLSDLLAIHYLFKNKSTFENEFGKDAAKIWHDAFGKRMESPEVQKVSSKFGFTFTVNDNPFIPMDNIYLSTEFGYIRVEGLADDLDSAIKFLNQQMLSFVPTVEEFNNAVRKTKQSFMMGHGNAAKKLFDAKLDSVLYGSNDKKTNVAELSYNNLLEFGKKYFSPANMIISVVSPASESEVIEDFSNFKDDKANSVNTLGKLRKFRTISSPLKIDITGGGEQSYLYYGFQKKIEDNEKAALTVLSLLLSDKIVFDIREKQGLAYRMSAGVDVKNDKAMFFIKMGTRPENVEKLIPQFPTFFTPDFIKEVSNNSIQKAVNMYLGRMMFRRLSSINQAYYLGHSKYFYNDINYDSKSLEKLKNVSYDDVIQAANKYLKVENPIEIIVR